MREGRLLSFPVAQSQAMRGRQLQAGCKPPPACPPEWLAKRPLIRREHSTGLYSAPVVWLTLSLDALALLVLSFLLYSVQYALQRLQASGGHKVVCGGPGRAGGAHLARACLAPQMAAANYFVWLAAVILTTVGSFFLGFAVGGLQCCQQEPGHGRGPLATPMLQLPAPIFLPACSAGVGQRAHGTCNSVGHLPGAHLEFWLPQPVPPGEAWGVGESPAGAHLRNRSGACAAAVDAAPQRCVCTSLFQVYLLWLQQCNYQTYSYSERGWGSGRGVCSRCAHTRQQRCHPSLQPACARVHGVQFSP